VRRDTDRCAPPDLPWWVRFGGVGGRGMRGRGVGIGRFGGGLTTGSLGGRGFGLR
jgi:hypothetical protein